MLIINTYHPISAIYYSSRKNDVIDLEDHSYALGCECESADGYQSGLYYILIEHVNNSVSSHVNAAEFLSLDVLVAELSNERDWVHAGIFSKGVGDELKGFSV